MLEDWFGGRGADGFGVCVAVAIQAVERFCGVGAGVRGDGGAGSRGGAVVDVVGPGACAFWSGRISIFVVVVIMRPRGSGAISPGAGAVALTRSTLPDDVVVRVVVDGDVVVHGLGAGVHVTGEDAGV